MEGSTPGRGFAPAARGHTGGLDARTLVNLDSDPGEPGACTVSAPAGSGGARPRREDLVELVGWGDLELVVAAIPRLLIRPPAQEGRRMAKTVALEVIVLDLAHP